MPMRIAPASGLVAAVAALMLLSTAPSRAQEGADKVYKDGLEAIEKQRWAEAASAMRDAIKMNSSEAPGGRRLLVIGRVDYLPHLLLGRVLLVQMDCTGALDAWEESDRQGVARKVKDGEHVREIESGYATCEAKGFLPSPKFRKELDEARGVVRGAADEGRRLAEHVSAFDDSIKAAHRKQVALAESRMRTANDKMAEGERTRRAQDLADARAAAGLALAEYRAARAPLDVLIQAVGSFQAKIKGAESELAAVDGRGRELDTLLSEAPVKVAPNDAVVAARGKSDALVASAREKIRTASRTQAEAALAEAAQLIADADKAYRQLRFDIEALIRAAVDREWQLLQTRMQGALAGIEARVREIVEALRTQPPSDQTRKDFETAQRGLQRARQSFDRALRARDLEQARAAVLLTPRLASQLDALAAGLAIATPTLPDSLKAAAQAFFDGSYADAIRLLPADQVESIDLRFRIHGHVVRAAALFAQFQRSGSADASLRDQALREVEQSRAIDPSFQPNPAAFSPRFVAFFRGAPGEAQ